MPDHIKFSNWFPFKWFLVSSTSSRSRDLCITKKILIFLPTFFASLSTVCSCVKFFPFLLIHNQYLLTKSIAYLDRITRNMFRINGYLRFCTVSTQHLFFAENIFAPSQLRGKSCWHYTLIHNHSYLRNHKH